MAINVSTLAVGDMVPNGKRTMRVVSVLPIRKDERGFPYRWVSLSDGKRTRSYPMYL